MAKYRVEVGGFVTVYRQRLITVTADSDSEAGNKAINKFIEQQLNGSGSPVCEGGNCKFDYDN